MTTPNNQKRNHSNQARPDVDRDIRDAEEIRGLIHIAENGGKLIAYYGTVPPPTPTTGSRRLFGQVMKAKNKGDAYSFYERPGNEDELEARHEAPDGSRDSDASHGQTNFREYSPPTADMLAEFFDLAPDLQEMMKLVSAGGRHSPLTPEMLKELLNLSPKMQKLMKFLMASEANARGAPSSGGRNGPEGSRR